MKVIHKGNGLFWSLNNETVCIEPWGKDVLRVRATKGHKILDHLPGALVEPAVCECTISITESSAAITNGKIKAQVNIIRKPNGDTPKGALTFINTETGEVLLEELSSRIYPEGRVYKSLNSNLYKMEALFNAYEGERIYGLGQHGHGFLDQKGCVIDLHQVNGEVSIPFMVSSRGYGFLWNNPAIGRVELGTNTTRWVAEVTQQLDYLVMAGDSYADIMERYADATGHSPVLPEWAAGFWQSKLRYLDQEELLTVAREYKKRGLPLSVIVIDYFHWTAMGDWKFDSKCWPDPSSMVRELEAMGIKVMISIWPSVNRNSENFDELQERGLLVSTERGATAINCFMDTKNDDKIYLHYYDPTNPEARKFVWDQAKKNYYDHGIKVWWLDACEPEIRPRDYENLRYYAGTGLEVGCLYPLMNQLTFHEGMKSQGEEDVVMLSRSAWAGSQRLGAAVWSGDIHTDFKTLREQVKAGLNIAMSGIPWWTTDIGGFVGGNPQSESYRELIIRWFQYGVFCPLFRLHGLREPGNDKSGGPNEVWSYGEEAYEIIKDLLFLRERLKPYIMEQMKAASEKGSPVIRPLFYEFAKDPKCYEVEDQFLFGPDLMIAPVLYEGARSREVYLPKGEAWTDAWTGEKHQGGQMIDVNAPIDRIPLFLRSGRKLPIRD